MASLSTGTTHPADIRSDNFPLALPEEKGHVRSILGLRGAPKLLEPPQSICYFTVGRRPTCIEGKQQRVALKDVAIREAAVHGVGDFRDHVVCR